MKWRFFHVNSTKFKNLFYLIKPQLLLINISAPPEYIKLINHTENEVNLSFKQGKKDDFFSSFIRRLPELFDDFPQFSMITQLQSVIYSFFTVEPYSWNPIRNLPPHSNHFRHRSQISTKFRSLKFRLFRADQFCCIYVNLYL